MVKIKVCGITNIEDAMLAQELGADFLGFIFYRKSPRYIDIENAFNIISKLSSKVKKVGVFVNQEAEEINQTVSTCKLDYVQLHGDEDPNFIKKVNAPAIKAFRVKDSESIDKAAEYDVFAYLFDSYNDNFYGGTGKSFNLNLIATKQFEKPIFLSGGLNVDNVKESIEKIEPYAVDVCSGVEASPGKKDKHKLKAFIDIVKNN